VWPGRIVYPKGIAVVMSFRREYRIRLDVVVEGVAKESQVQQALSLGSKAVEVAKCFFCRSTWIMSHKRRKSLRKPCPPKKKTRILRVYSNSKHLEVMACPILVQLLSMLCLSPAS
jgi:hypothetical protein